MSLRVLTMADVPENPNAGAAGTEVRTIEALRALGHQVDSIWAPQLGRRIAHGNLHYLLELPRAYERAAIAALGRKSYDVVHVNQPHGYRAARAVHRLSPRTVFVHRSHGFELNVEETLQSWRGRFRDDDRRAVRRIASGVLAALIRRHSFAIAREADGHIVSSTSDASFLQERLRLSRNRIAVIAQAPPDSFVESAAPPFDARRSRRILYVGQYAFVKAPMIVADAIKRLASADQSLHFTWVCDAGAVPAVRALLGGVANVRTDVTPWVPQESLRDLYDAHGTFLFPSFYEGFGKAFLEAMSRGACVVASDVGGAHDVITSGVDGMLVPPGDPDAIVSAVESLLADPERAAAMSAAAARVARQYTWERVARETAAFYERLSSLK